MTNAVNRTAEELMQADVETTDPGATVVEAAKKMNRTGVSNLPVVDKEGRLLGILSEADTLKSMVNELYFDEPPDKVQDVMRRFPLCVTIDTEIFRIANLLTDYGFRHIPVVRDGKLAGIVSRRDVLLAIEEVFESSQTAEKRKTYSKLDEFPNLPLLK